MRARLLAAALIAPLLPAGCAARAPSAPPAAPPVTAAAPAPADATATDSSSPLDAVVRPGAAWYDASPLMTSLRQRERPRLLEAVGVAHLEDLPLYDLTVRIDPAAGLFDLDEQLWFTNRESSPLGEVELRIYGNPEPLPGNQPSRGPLITMSSGQCESVACTIFSPSPSLLVVKPPKPLQPGDRLRIRLSLQGVLERRNPQDTGLLSQGIASLGALSGAKVQSDYGLLSVCGGFVSMANFYAVVARRRNGAWDKPEAAAFGDIGPDELSNVRARVIVPALYHAITPGIEASQALLPARGDQPPARRYDIGAAAVRNFAVFAGDGLQSVSRNVDDVTLRSTFREGDQKPAERVLDVAQNALAIFEKRFGPYPWADLDIVEAPLVGGAGGVEFTGLVAVAGMLYRPFEPDDPMMRLLPALGAGTSTQISSLMDATLEFTTAHEVAHQWWYGLVGTDSRDHPFVDESLAQYSTIIYLEDRYGQARARKDGDTNVRMNYVAMRMLGGEDGAVDRPASAFGTPIGYAGLVYGKGPYLYRELRKSLGDQRFFAGLRAYADKYRFRTAPGRGPVDSLAAQADGEKVRAIARRWLDERHGDQDLGPIDMTSLLTNVLGPDAGQLAPAMEQLMKALEPGGP